MKDTKPSAAPARIALPQEITMGNVTEIYGTLAETLDSDSLEIEIDAGEVARIDTAGLQLIHTFSSTLRERGVTVRWSEPSSTFATAAKEVGWESLTSQTR